MSGYKYVFYTLSVNSDGPIASRRQRYLSRPRHDDEASNDQRCSSFKGTDILGIRYCYPPVRARGSDLCTVRTAGINLSTWTRIVWRRGKANINRLLGNPPLDAPRKTHTAHGASSRLPYEIVEMIIAHIAHDLDALKACSSTCRSWYIAAVPHIHRTLTLTDGTRSITHRELKPLSQLHQLGLVPLIKEIRVYQQRGNWLAPQAFSPGDLSCFSAFPNVQSLRLQYLEISHFIPGIERYFGHFSSTLRSIALLEPTCTPRQLSYFLSLFPNLDNIAIWHTPTLPPNITIPDTELVPLSTPRLQGRLMLRQFDSAETCICLVTLCGGLRFRYMNLCMVGGCVPVLFEACAETLETLRFHAADEAGK
jgi:hypothetical protein